MKILPLTAILLSGLVSIASATPDDRESSDRVSYTKDKPVEDAAAPTSALIEMATPTPCAHGRTFVTIDKSATPVTQIQISATNGRPVVKAIKIVFTDGTRRYVKLDKTIDPRKPHKIDLRGNKQIQVMVIDSDWRVKGSYAIHGVPSRKAVAFR